MDLPGDMLVAVEGSGIGVEGPFREAKQEAVRDFERSYLSKLLAETGGNVSEAARRSGMKRTALHRLLVRHDLHRAEFKE